MYNYIPCFDRALGRNGRHGDEEPLEGVLAGARLLIVRDGRGGHEHVRVVVLIVLVVVIVAGLFRR